MARRRRFHRVSTRSQPDSPRSRPRIGAVDSKGRAGDAGLDLDPGARAVELLFEGGQDRFDFTPIIGQRCEFEVSAIRENGRLELPRPLLRPT